MGEDSWNLGYLVSGDLYVEMIGLTFPSAESTSLADRE